MLEQCLSIPMAIIEWISQSQVCHPKPQASMHAASPFRKQASFRRHIGSSCGPCSDRSHYRATDSAAVTLSRFCVRVRAPAGRGDVCDAEAPGGVQMPRYHLSLRAPPRLDGSRNTCRAGSTARRRQPVRVCQAAASVAAAAKAAFCTSNSAKTTFVHLLSFPHKARCSLAGGVWGSGEEPGPKGHGAQHGGHFCSAPTLYFGFPSPGPHLPI
jgi:hypothetical protein